MPTLIKKPAIVKAAGNMDKTIEEYIGTASSGTKEISIARMISPCGWAEPGQTPDFDEYTLVIKGVLEIETKDETLYVTAGNAVITPKGEWVRYSTPGAAGAEYIAICLPAYTDSTVNRE